MSTRDEKSSKRVLAVAGAVLRDAKARVLGQSINKTIAEMKMLAGSVVTQAPDKKKRRP